MSNRIVSYSIRDRMKARLAVAALDNAVARRGVIAGESFFALLQKNVLNRQRWDTRDNVRLALVTWIERTYHRRRRQTRLGRLTPVEFEAIIKPPPPSQPNPNLSPDHSAVPLDAGDGLHVRSSA